MRVSQRSLKCSVIRAAYLLVSSAACTISDDLAADEVTESAISQSEDDAVTAGCVAKNAVTSTCGTSPIGTGFVCFSTHFKTSVSCGHISAARSDGGPCVDAWIMYFPSNGSTPFTSPTKQVCNNTFVSFTNDVLARTDFHVETRVSGVRFKLDL